jgi:hypothetical protein
VSAPTTRRRWAWATATGDTAQIWSSRSVWGHSRDEDDRGDEGEGADHPHRP